MVREAVWFRIPPAALCSVSKCPVRRGDAPCCARMERLRDCAGDQCAAKHNSGLAKREAGKAANGLGLDMRELWLPGLTRLLGQALRAWPSCSSAARSSASD